MNIIEFDRKSDIQRQGLFKLFKAYCDDIYSDEPENKMSDYSIMQFFEWILNDCNYEDGWIFLAVDARGQFVGFIFAHIDRPEKGWCAKEGWGCIREIYVTPKFRQKGTGESLIKHSESAMAAFNPKGHYLTSDNNDLFWNKAGYFFDGEIEKLNNSRVFAKR